MPALIGAMGRLTLNVLLSFAQFEREVIGERVRDKIAASKRKGLWVGGPVPLGYLTDGKKLVVMPTEAKIVRTIFALYLEIGSIAALAEALECKGIRTKVRPLSNGESRGGIPFGVGALAHLLRNRFYVGEIDYRGEIHPGEHEAILDRPLFDKVQAKLTKSAIDRAIRLKGSPALLMGRIFDDAGNRMGHQRAFAMLVMGRTVNAEDARQAGFVNAIVAPGHTETEARKVAREICALPAEAVAISRKLLKLPPDEMIRRINEESALFGERMRSDEAVNAFKAFFARKKA